MRDMAEAVEFVRSNLGNNPAAAFRNGVDEFVCYVRHHAIFESNNASPQMRNNFASIASGILLDAIKAFLAENYISADGILEAHMHQNEFFDLGMNPIREIANVQQCGDLMETIVREATREYETGKRLGADMCLRAGQFEAKFIGPRKELPAPTGPALETLEIEMMRLERRLPSLSKDEGNRLSQLYLLVKTPARA